ncbi:MAG: DUF975 family protein [Clostridia bacterium]|nr:DUF975 family protein [Clostridia bacterium]
MMNSKELRAKAWDSLKGKYWMAFAVVIVAGIIGSIANGFTAFGQGLSEVLGLVDPSEMDEVMELGALVLNGVGATASVVGLVLSIFINNAMTVGTSNYFIKNTYSKPEFADVFSGFKVKYGRNIGTLLMVGIKTVLWSLLFVIPGIIKSYEYAIIPYILADDPEISSKEAFKKAKEMMKGNKMRLFKLQFSFIGWGLLCVLTAGVGTFFLIPYVNAAEAEFYTELKNK